MNTKAKSLLLVVVIILPLTIFMYARINLNHAPKSFNYIIKIKLIDVNISMNEYFEMKYSQRPHPQQLMNMSLTLAESGALALRTSPEAADSLDYGLLMRRSLINKMAHGDKDRAIGNTTREATALVKRERAFPNNDTDFSTTRSENRPENSTNGTSRNLKNILYWNECGHRTDFNFGLGEEAFIKRHCAVSACYAIEDPHMVPEVEIDAILFCLHLNSKDFALPPLPRFPNAKRVVMAREAPARFRKSLQMYGDMFDYTIAYRYDSDARTGYGKVVEVPENDLIDSFSKIIEVTHQKRKMAAWFVSNCRDAPSNRDKLAKEMQRHGIDIDIYGACGTLTCSRDSRADCFKMLEKEYKFYLSFENSLCNHYVTEKFTNILRYNIVPVTYGLGHELLGVPKDAYIDVFDFADVESLAQHLQYLASNDSAYNEYFRWKKHFRVTGYSGYEHPFCKMCADLHADPPLPQRKYDLQAWFSEGQCINVKKNRRLKKFLGIDN